MSIQVTKLTVSIPQELVELADKVAKEKKISRSKVVASCLQELERQKLQADLEEGYRAMAVINKQIAKETFEAQRDVAPEW